MIYNPNTHLRRAPDGEYGSDRIAGTLARFSYVKYDGRDWIITNVSDNTYTLMLKKIAKKIVHSDSVMPGPDYGKSNLYMQVCTFANSMSKRARKKLNYKTIGDSRHVVWLASSEEIMNWTERSATASHNWYGIRGWGQGDGIYDGVGTRGYWCSDVKYYSPSEVLEPDAYVVFDDGDIGVSGSRYQSLGFRPCIEVVQ